MNNYKVYKHDTFGYKAIKDGVSWTAFFFSWIWMAINKLWGVLAIWIIVGLSMELYLENYMYTFDSYKAGFENHMSDSESLIILLISLVYLFGPLLYGNKVLQQRLEGGGYKLNTTTAAESEKMAIAIAMGEYEEHLVTEGKKESLEGYIILAIVLFIVVAAFI